MQGHCIALALRGVAVLTEQCEVQDHLLVLVFQVVQVHLLPAGGGLGSALAVGAVVASAVATLLANFGAEKPQE